MEIKKIDINCDLGESYGRFRVGQDEAVFPWISSANVACGYHGGDPLTIRRTLQLAKQHEVRVGAHPGYPDLMGFGRRYMNIAEDELIALIQYQIAAVRGLATLEGLNLSYVKPHGALYNAAANDEKIADCLLTAVEQFGDSIALMGLSGSLLELKCQVAGIGFIKEAFADRRYDENGKLVSRKLENSVIVDAEEAVNQVLQIIKNRKVKTLQGKEIAMTADSICIHGDNPNAVSILKAIHEALTNNGVEMGS